MALDIRRRFYQKTNNIELCSNGERLEQLVSAISGCLVNDFIQNLNKVALRILFFIKYLEFIHNEVEVRSRGKQSIAFVDWSAMNHTYKLLCDEPDLGDPLVTLPDFGTLNACIFFGKVAFIYTGQLAH